MYIFTKTWDCIFRAWQNFTFIIHLFKMVWAKIHVLCRKSSGDCLPMIMHFNKFGKKNAFARATVILSSLVIWFSRKSWSWMVLFGSLLNQFVGRFDRANGLSIFQFDALTFLQKILIDGFNGLWTVVLSLISEITRSRLMLELMLLLCRFWVLKRVARSQLLCLFNVKLMMVPTILLVFRDFFWRLGLLEYWIRSFVLSSMGRRWTHPRRLASTVQLSFRGHWPYRFRSDDCNR